MSIVSRPQEGHNCGVNDYGICSHWWDAPGTVRVCDECGRTWVALRDRNPGMLVTRWQPEGRYARWRRERRERTS